MIKFPIIDGAERMKKLEYPSGMVPMVLDTDTYNEVDDQFALTYGLLSPEKLDIKAIYAAPFHNDRSTGAGDGMIKSYEEILRLLGKMPPKYNRPVLKGSKRFMTDHNTPVDSLAARDLIARAMERSDDDPLYVVAIGAITNVASALLLEPAIVKKVVVVWLAGQPLHWPSAREFNLSGDIYASQVIFDSGVPLVLVPCSTVASHLTTTVPEMKAHIGGKNELCDALIELFSDYSKDHFAWAKEIWDIATIGWLLNPSCMPSVLEPTPILSDDGNWSRDPNRPLMRVITMIWRNQVFRDMFEKLGAMK